MADHLHDPNDMLYVGNYLLERLKQIGVKQMFGVPGDFNLGFLDLVEDSKHIGWVGNCNELNAAYAADGYARVNEESIGVLCTTFGVGELSAINGIAGAFSERVPVLHIAGVPSTSHLRNKPLLHHTLGDGRFDAYTKAAAQVTMAQATLMDKNTAAAEIDRILTSCWTSCHPVYLALPTDIVYEKVPALHRLKTPLTHIPPPNDTETEEFVLNQITKLVEAAFAIETPGDAVVVLVDACTIRHKVRDEVTKFIETTGFPVYAAPMGKSAVFEGYERYGGIYVGSVTHEDIKAKVESAKLIISIGALKSDFNTGNFTYSIPLGSTVELHSDHTKVQFAMYPKITMKHLLPKLTSKLASYNQKALSLTVPKFTASIPEDPSDIISQEWFWPKVGTLFKPKDVVVTETGTSNFGILDIPFPKDAVFVSQLLWGSIGWSVGSTLGVALAARDLNLGKVILFVGDGSLQLTVQEISSMIHHGLKPIIFVLNNSGYTIERFLHGKTRKYNDIVNWKWTSLLSVFSGEEGKTCQSYKVDTKSELSSLLENPEFLKTEKIQLVEVIMDKFDAPRALKAQAELSGKANKYAPETL